MSNKEKQKKIILTGGGTAGSVVPLLAIFDELKEDYSFEWYGTFSGVEKNIVKEEGIKYLGVFSGKLRRYFSLRNIIDVVLVFFGVLQSFVYLIISRPQLIITAGSYVSVPIIIAGKFLRIPILVHQLDFKPGLANRVMSILATKITVSLEKSLDDYGNKAVWTGSLVRRKFKEQHEELDIKKKEELPTIFVLGGSTGAEGINNIMEYGIDELAGFCNVIHLTGRGKKIKVDKFNYNTFEFFNSEQMIKAYNTADLVICRAGMATLTELSYLAKPSIIIPMPDSHQEDNAKIFAEQMASIVLSQKELLKDKFIQTVKDLLTNKEMLKQLGDNAKSVIPSDVDNKLINIIKKMIN